MENGILQNLEIFWKAKLATARNNFSADLDIKGDIVVTDIQTGNVKPFDPTEVLVPKSRDYMYKLDFWDGYNIVPPDADMEHAFHAVACGAGRC